MCDMFAALGACRVTSSASRCERDVSHPIVIPLSPLLFDFNVRSRHSTHIRNKRASSFEYIGKFKFSYTLEIVGINSS